MLAGRQCRKPEALILNEFYKRDVKEKLRLDRRREDFVSRSSPPVRTYCEKAGLEHIAPHDLRRTCAKLCHDRGGELEQIQFLLGHASVQTTKRISAANRISGIQ